jgi:uridylate kinase
MPKKSKDSRQGEFEIAIVIGGGNIFEFARYSNGMDRVQELYGNAATVINGIALQGALEDKECLVCKRREDRGHCALHKRRACTP